MSNQFDMRCPKCGSEDYIDIVATTVVRLVDDGTTDDFPDGGNHEWDDDSPASCASCGHAGWVYEYKPGVDR